jgi:uncharacterized protein (DUF58 family)
MLKVSRLCLRLLLPASAALILIGAPLAHAETPATEIRFADHQFVPQNLTVAAGQDLVIRVVNDSKETIEFESFTLNREKALAPGETTNVRLPALAAGSYDFYDDFHQDVPEGTILAK